MPQNYLLDIEGTVCPIVFVKEELFPFFLAKLPELLRQYEYPLTASTDAVSQTLAKFPAEITKSSDSLYGHLTDLVARDVKDPLLKQLQGLVWQAGYDSGDIKCPVYTDAIDAIRRWVSEGNGVYIYSSGSVKAQKLLFGHVLGAGDMNALLSGYFDTINAGPKTEAASYKRILSETGLEGADVLFLSDNVNEVKAAIEAGMESHVVCRPGNAPISAEDSERYTVVSTFAFPGGALFGLRAPAARFWPQPISGASRQHAP